MEHQSAAMSQAADVASSIPMNSGRDRVLPQKGHAMAQFVRVPVRTGSITINADRVTYIRESSGSASEGWCEVYFDAGRSVTVNLTVEALVSLTAKR
jgi:hypothetical protein